MKKEHGFLKALAGILIIMGLSVIGTLIFKSAGGGYLGGAIGGIADLFIFIIKKSPETAGKTEDVQQ